MEAAPTIAGAGTADEGVDPFAPSEILTLAGLLADAEAEMEVELPTAADFPPAAVGEDSDTEMEVEPPDADDVQGKEETRLEATSSQAAVALVQHIREGQVALPPTAPQLTGTTAASQPAPVPPSSSVSHSQVGQLATSVDEFSRVVGIGLETEKALRELSPALLAKVVGLGPPLANNPSAVVMRRIRKAEEAERLRLSDVVAS